jgi:hypothetical protein
MLTSPLSLFHAYIGGMPEEWFTKSGQATVVITWESLTVGNIMESVVCLHGKPM